jgi:ubiquitin carboxyl-terminal hydrolase 7
MLLVASMLPRNTFSLRWLALSGVGVGVVGANAGCVGGGGGIGRYRVVRSNLEWKLFSERNGYDVPSSSWSRIDLDHEGRPVLPGEGTTEGRGGAEDDVESWNGNAPLMAILWSDIAATLEVTSNAKENGDHSSSLVGIDDGSWDWSIVDSILGRIPRGGGGDRGGGDHDRTYTGLVNMGNTCYLNAQLQCAYHIPYLRRLVLDAKDEIVKVEMEVDVEIETDEVDEAVTICENNRTLDCSDAKLSEGKMTKSAEVSADEHLPELENCADSSSTNDTARQPIEAKKRVIVKKVVKEEILPISQALRALKITFNSLDSSLSSSGTTSVLCRTLGINPYIQQDGQEFWKLFIPEIRYDQLERLYSGYFEDDVREILPDGEESAGEELTMAVEDYGEEKKDEDDIIASSTEGVKTHKARERIRKELFLDLSIPVSERAG